MQHFRGVALCGPFTFVNNDCNFVFEALMGRSHPPARVVRTSPVLNRPGVR